MTYTYDALGRRIWESANGGRAFLYDGQRMIETRLGAANALASNAHEQYVYGKGYVDDVVLRDAEVNGGGNLGITGSGLDQRLYYQQDREYNVVALVDQGGNVVERYAYDSYGSVSALDANWNVLSSGSAYGNQVGFTGRWLDDTGMWYFRARYYEPTLGRFIERDTININGFNLYCAYFCPSFIDPSGRSYGSIDDVTWDQPSGNPLNGHVTWTCHDRGNMCSQTSAFPLGVAPQANTAGDVNQILQHMAWSAATQLVAQQGANCTCPDGNRQNQPDALKISKQEPQNPDEKQPNYDNLISIWTSINSNINDNLPNPATGQTAPTQNMVPDTSFAVFIDPEVEDLLEMMKRLHEFIQKAREAQDQLDKYNEKLFDLRQRVLHRIIQSTRGCPQETTGLKGKPEE